MKTNIKYGILLIGFGFFGLHGNAQDLKDYLDMATENNPKLKAAYAEYNAANEIAPQVSTLPDPTLAASAFGGMETFMGTEQANFQLMQMFPWFGTLAKKENASNLMAEAKFQQYLDIQNEVHFEVKSAYYNLYELGKTIELQKENLEILDSYRELSLSKFRSGSSKMVNVVRIDIERDAARTQIELLEDQLIPLQAEFNLMLNRDPGLKVEIQDTLVFSENESLDQKENLFKEHPKVVQFQKQYEAYTTQQEIAKKEGLPMLGIGLDYTVMSRNSMAMPDMNGRDMLMPMVSVSLPIFRKKYNAMKKEAEFMAEGMREEGQMQKNELRAEYEMTLFKLKKAQKLIDLYKRQIESSQQANKLLISGFANATEDFEEVLRMNQDILMFKTQQITAIKEGLQAKARMEYLMVR